MMADGFDAAKIEAAGWRQGAVLGEEVVEAAIQAAPEHVQCQEDDWLILTSHDCDIVNPKLENEPVIEVLRAFETTVQIDKTQNARGRNPRILIFEGDNNRQRVTLECHVHDRWTLSRELLLNGQPCKERNVDERTKRSIVEWLAKRYIREAFPNQFNGRWRKKMKKWNALLLKYNDWIQGIYILLNTFDEIAEEKTPYLCEFLVSIPGKLKSEPIWPKKREEIENDFIKFWYQFEPGIVCETVDVLGTDEITLEDMSRFKRFDADWLSFSEDDDCPVTPLAADLRT